jgi:hypothetical protein
VDKVVIVEIIVMNICPDGTNFLPYVGIGFLAKMREIHETQLWNGFSGKSQETIALMPPRQCERAIQVSIPRVGVYNAK